MIMTTKNNPYVTCNKCGRVYFGRTRKALQKDIDEANKHFEELPDEDKCFYGGLRDIRTHLGCELCGNSFKDFHLTTKEEDGKILGCTIGPIMLNEELVND